jgi:hypothetical protein
MVPDIRVTWHDTSGYLIYVVMVLRRATLDGVPSAESRVRIAECICNRSGGNIRRHAASEIEMHGELSGRATVDHLDISDAAANITGQRQIAGLDRGGVNSLVPVHIKGIVTRRRWREGAANGRIGVGHH